MKWVVAFRCHRNVRQRTRSVNSSGGVSSVSVYPKHNEFSVSSKHHDKGTYHVLN